MTNPDATAKLLKLADDYTGIALEHLVEYVHVDEDDLERLEIDLQTMFLFPTLSKMERFNLGQLRYLGKWLADVRCGKTFGLTPQQARDFASKVRQLSAERTALKRRVIRSDLAEKLTDDQKQVLKAIYLPILSSEEYGRIGNGE